MGMWGPYVPVHMRRMQAKKKMEQLKKQGKVIEPVELQGKTIAQEFWGKKWCDHIESLADYANRLSRGKTYVRNGSVCHLGISEGAIEAKISGSSVYTVTMTVEKLAKDKWEAIKRRCSGQIGSILELLQGKISKNIMEIVSDVKQGLFPHPKEISYDCSCPDWAGMCKHVAAVFYGVGSRLDQRPELLFALRGVNPQELISMPVSVRLESEIQANVLKGDDLADLFNIQFAEESPSQNTIQVPSAKKKREPKSKIDIDTLTGPALKRFRKVKRISVSELAKAIGVTPPSIYRWEATTGILKLQAKPKKALQAFLKAMDQPLMVMTG